MKSRVVHGASAPYPHDRAIHNEFPHTKAGFLRSAKEYENLLKKIKTESTSAGILKHWGNNSHVVFSPHITVKHYISQSSFFEVII
jgi:hypothetical protein